MMFNPFDQFRKQAVGAMALRGFLAMVVLSITACTTTPTADKVDNYWDGYTTVAISPSGQMVAVANRFVVVLFDIEQQRQVGWFWALDEKGRGFKLPRAGLGDTMDFIDDSHIVTTGMGGMATVWDIRNGQKTQHSSKALFTARSVWFTQQVGLRASLPDVLSVRGCHPYDDSNIKKRRQQIRACCRPWLVSAESFPQLVKCKIHARPGNIDGQFIFIIIL